MARLNLTIPDPLYERYERARDRVNVSKVCAEALERELDMLEARPSIADPRVAALVERLRGTKEEWYQYGHEDGQEWGLESATRAAFAWVGGHTASAMEAELSAYDKAEPYDQPSLPPVVGAARAAFLQRVRHKAEVDASGAVPYSRQAAVEEKADRAAYMAGWFDALTELHKAISPALRR